MNNLIKEKILALISKQVREQLNNRLSIDIKLQLRRDIDLVRNGILDGLIIDRLRGRMR